MTTEEMSNLFDTLIYSYSSNKPFGLGQTALELDEYEKSVLLTEAQESLVKELYKGSFEANEELRRALDALVTTYKSLPLSMEDSPKLALTDNSYFYQLPNDLMYITHETVLLNDESLGCKNNKYIEVIPVRQDELDHTIENPFRGASYRRVLRVDTGYPYVELISKYNISTYLIKYLRRPTPIILVDLTEDHLSIDGLNTVKACELNEALHKLIVEKAVLLAAQRIALQGKTAASAVNDSND